MTDISDELIDEHRFINTDHGWWEFVVTDFHEVAKRMGFGVDVDSVSFSGFCNQGDGASFTGTYWAYDQTLFAETGPEAVRNYAPKATTLHEIADELLMISRIYFPAYAKISRMGTMYSHAATMNIDEVEPVWAEDIDFDEDVYELVRVAILEQTKKLADWLYRQLEKEYEYLTTDEAVKNAIIANDLHLTEETT